MTGELLSQRLEMFQETVRPFDDLRIEDLRRKTPEPDIVSSSSLGQFKAHSVVLTNQYCRYNNT